MKKFRLISLVLLVLFCITSFISTAFANTVTVSSSTTDTHEISLVRQGNDYVGSVEIPLKDDSTDNTDSTMSPDGIAFVRLTVQLYQMPNSNLYEYYYTVTCTGDYLINVKGRFKLVNTSVLTPTVYSDNTLNETFPGTQLRVKLISTCYIPPNAVSVKAVCTGVTGTTIQSGTASLIPFGTAVWNIPLL